jgi:hypothetical protein
LCSRCDPVEAGYTVHVITGGDTGDMRAVAEAVEYQIQLRLRAACAEVGSDRYPRLSTLHRPGKGFSGDEIIVHRSLTGERVIAVGIREHDPAIPSPGNNDRKCVAYNSVAVEIRCRWRTERKLCDRTAVVRPAGAQSRHPAKAGQLSAGDLYRISGWSDPPEPNCTLIREIPQIEQLRCVGRGSAQTGNARIDAGVQNTYQDAASVVCGMLFQIVVDAGACERHPAVGKRSIWGYHRLQAVIRIRLRHNRRGRRLRRQPPRIDVWPR